MSKLWLILVMVPVFSFAQSRKEKKALEAKMKAEQELVANLKTCVSEIHSASQQSATNNYIANAFKTIGLQPKGTNDYLQTFIIEEGKTIDTATHFVLNDVPLQLFKEYYPLAYSANKASTGMPAMDLKEKGEPWFFDMREWTEPGKYNPALNLDSLIKKEVERVNAKGATALIIFNSGSSDDKLVFKKMDSSAIAPIPVIYITATGLAKHFNDRTAMLDVDLNVALTHKKEYGHNVIGYLDNGAASTVLIGTQFPCINKTDDVKASSAAALIELARTLKTTQHKNNNYLLAAICGEQGNTAGFEYLLNSSLLPSGINYMVNIEDVGTYNENQKLLVGGYASSSLWPEVFTTLKNNEVAVKFDSSDGTNGLLSMLNSKEIPMIYFTTAASNNNPKLASNVNYEGEVHIVQYIQQVLETADTKGKIVYAKSTVQRQPSALSRYTVSFGVIPDNAFAGKGFRIVGVSPKKLADKLGLQPGDVLLKLGQYDISEMNSYLQALSMFKQGDKTTLKLRRGNDEQQINVVF